MDDFYSYYFNQFDKIPVIHAEYKKICGCAEGYALINVICENEYIPLNIQTCGGEYPKDLKKDDRLKIKLVLFMDEGKLYKDEKDYKANSGRKFAAQSVIPSGTFHPKGDSDFIQNPSVIVSGKVLSCEQFPDTDGDICLKIMAKCLSFKFCIIAAATDLEWMPEVGNIIDGMFTCVGDIARA